MEMGNAVVGKQFVYCKKSNGGINKIWQKIA